MLNLMKKSIKILLVFIFLIVIGAFVLFRIWKNVEVSGISNFEECTAYNYPIQDSYPPRCSTPDGKTFTQDIGNELEYTDLIRIDTPRPNSNVVSPLNIKGVARGSWFWEANSTAEIYDGNGLSKGSGFVIAVGESMTEDFVRMEGVIEFEKPETPTGKLILRNDNPSGLVENQKELIIPVKF